MDKKRKNVRNNHDEIIKKMYKKSDNVRIKKDKYRPVRTGWLLIGFVFLFIVILLSFANTQILNAGKLKEIAVNQQITKKSILAKRGNILDRNGEVLAQSIEVDTVTANPKLLKNKKGEGINKEELAETASKIFDVNKQELLNDLNSEKSVITIAKKQEKEKIEQLKKYLDDNNIVQGINIDKDTKRFYPYNDVASNVIGFLGTDNVGLEGIEKKLDSVLKGKEGRIVSQSDVNRNFTKESPEQLIQAEDGKNIYLTLDIKLQSSVEKYLKQAIKDTEARDGIAVVMSTKTGEVLAMANYPTYNLNTPFAPIGMDNATWDKLDAKTQTNLRYDAWKNKAVAEAYEPGSTFKIITTAIGLEEAKTTTDKPGDFICTGVQKVYDWDIKCWRSYNPHGSQTLRQALENSCNPAFIQLGQRIGTEMFYKYMSGFGLTGKTGIELLRRIYTNTL
jgi:peptidoglycan glycosyltransferase